MSPVTAPTATMMAMTTTAVGSTGRHRTAPSGVEGVSLTAGRYYDALMPRPAGSPEIAGKVAV
jgi:hypothetical protein